MLALSSSTRLCNGDVSICPGAGQIPLNEPMHEDSLKQLKLGSRNVMNALIGVSGFTNDGLFGLTTAMVYTHIRRYIPYGCRSSVSHLPKDILKTYEWSIYKMLLFMRIRYFSHSRHVRNR